MMFKVTICKFYNIESRFSNNNIIQDSKDSVLYETLNSVILSEAKYLRI